MKAVAVIGMNYGDEGKGHITNYFSDENTLNIRFNGGSQASHAVFLSDGRSHVFHHFGSGTLRGARTLLASHFIVNPIIFARELWDLSKITPVREVFIDPRCRITTPYDMFINEFSAQHHKKNDTCGVGINETVERSIYRQLRISMRNFVESTDDELREKLKTIDNEYVPFRVKELGLPLDGFKAFSKIVGSEKAVDSFITLRSFMLKDNKVIMWPDDSLIDKFLSKDPKRKIIFEGAQGMLLDQGRKEFMPYLTRSSPGMKNILELLKTVMTEIDLDVYLVTRTYLTRHGDGPIFNPVKLPFPGVREETNIDNRFQGSMRYGYLNRKWYKEAVEETRLAFDKGYASCLQNWSVNVAMTCCDHVGDVFHYCEGDDNNPIKGRTLDLPGIVLWSSGKLETDVKEV